MNRCGQRTGFLTFTVCGGPVAEVCVRCGKRVCSDHLQSDPAGPLCPDCAVLGLDADEASRRGLDASYYRSRNDDGDMMIYSSSDYGSFDAFEGEGGEMGGGGAGGEWGGGDEDGASDEGSAADFQDS